MPVTPGSSPGRVAGRSSGSRRSGAAGAARAAGAATQQAQQTLATDHGGARAGAARVEGLQGERRDLGGTRAVVLRVDRRQGARQDLGGARAFAARLEGRPDARHASVGDAAVAPVTKVAKVFDKTSEEDVPSHPEPRSPTPRTHTRAVVARVEGRQGACQDLGGHAPLSPESKAAKTLAKTSEQTRRGVQSAGRRGARQDLGGSHAVVCRGTAVAACAAGAACTEG